MKRLLILCLLSFPLLINAQNFIGKTRPYVKKFLQGEIKKYDSLKITLTDNDTAIVYSIKEGKSLPADFIYRFDKEGKCKSEQIIAKCDSCFKKYLDRALADKKFEWKKINENQYVSKFSEYMVIELPDGNVDFSYTILRTDWDKALYKLLTGE